MDRPSSQNQTRDQERSQFQTLDRDTPTQMNYDDTRDARNASALTSMERERKSQSISTEEGILLEIKKSKSIVDSSKSEKEQKANRYKRNYSGSKSTHSH